MFFSRRDSFFPILIFWFAFNPTISFLSEASPEASPEGIPWPFRQNFFVGANFSDFQNYSKVPYLHGGMDIRVPAGTPIYSPVDGVLSITQYRIEASLNPPKFEYIRSPFLTEKAPRNKLFPKDQKELASRYIEVKILDKLGRQWFFRHINADDIPKTFISQSQSSVTVKSGDLLGTVIPWIEAVSPEPSRFDHVHLEILDESGNYLNPAAKFSPIPDTRPPKINGVWFVPNEETRAFPLVNGLPQTRGKIDIVSDIYDTSDGSNYRLSPFQISYSIKGVSQKGAEEAEAKKAVYKFEKLPIKGDRTQLATVIYKDQVVEGEKRIESQGNSSMRRFLFVLTNGDIANGYAPVNSFCTFKFPDGRYAVEIEAVDFSGNKTSYTQEFLIRNR